MAELTVIIPTIPGREQSLIRVLDGLAQQLFDFEDLEVVVVWDWEGSPEALPGDLPFSVRVVKHSENKGLAAARNTGLAHATTRYGMFIDDDIIPNPNSLAKHLAFHKSYTDPMVAAVGKYIWDDPHNGLVSWYQEEGNWSIFSDVKERKPFPFSGFRDIAMPSRSHSPLARSAE